MCMGCTGGKPSGKSGSYTPKKSGASKGSYKPAGRPSASSAYGKPSVKISFSGRK